MESHEVLKEAFSKSSPKAIAADLGVSLSLVYKWAQGQSAGGSGSRNPIDRIVEIYKLTNDPAIIEHLCEQCDGYFVKNPISHCKQGFEVLPATNEIVLQFSSLLTQISKAALDSSITDDEADEIRLCWDKLKGFGEGFVRCCEEGDFKRMNETPSQEINPEKPSPKQRLY